MPRWVLLVALLHTAKAEFYDTFTGKQISPAKYAEYQALNLVPYCAREVKTCDEHEPRRLDCSCNNLHYPPRGAQITPYRRMLPPVFGKNYDNRPATSGAPLPNVRSVRTAVMPDGRVSSNEFTYLVVNGMLVITGDCTSIHDTVNYVVFTTTCCITGETDPRCRPIYVPNDDIYLRQTNIRCLNLTRIITYQSLGCAPQSLPPERVNTVPPMLDLSGIYGIDEPQLQRSRETRGGRFRFDIVNGREWPPTGSVFCLQNQLPGENRCHYSANQNMNILMGSNVFGIWLFRNHNRIARQLEVLNPCWDDDRIFREAREINIASVNQIWYYEMFPALMGTKYLLEREIIYDTLGHVNDYNPKLEPRVTIEWVIVSRWFHSMQDGRIKKYTRKGKLLDELKIVDLTLRTGILPNNNTIEGITQGFFRQPSAAIDHLIDTEMGERVLGGLQTASDVMSSDLMKNREAGLPPYVDYRRQCHLPVPKDFDDMLDWMTEDEVDALRFKYEKVEDIDLLAGIIAEEPMHGSALPPTLMCVMADQLWWWRKADRFWYENDQHPGAFTKDQLLEIRHSTMARIICDNGDDVDAVQPHAFLVPGPGNKITNCKKLPFINLEAWKDNCGKDDQDHDPTPERPVWNAGPRQKVWSLNVGSAQSSWGSHRNKSAIYK